MGVLFKGQKPLSELEAPYRVGRCPYIRREDREPCFKEDFHEGLCRSRFQTSFEPGYCPNDPARTALDEARREADLEAVFRADLTAALHGQRTLLVRLLDTQLRQGLGLRCAVCGFGLDLDDDVEIAAYRETVPFHCSTRMSWRGWWAEQPSSVVR